MNTTTSSGRGRNIARLGAAAVAATMLAAALPAPAIAHDGHAHGDRGHDDTEVTLADVARANARYHSVVRAERSGFSGEIVPDCMDHPDHGGMGVHWINPDLLADGVINPLQPEAIVYELDTRGRKTLVAVEWVMLPNDEHPPEPDGGTGPTLFDRSFTWHPDLEVWKLHAWLFRPNPEGVFEDHNPWVQMCPILRHGRSSALPRPV